jgi:hypothetical protein
MAGQSSKHRSSCEIVANLKESGLRNARDIVSLAKRVLRFLLLYFAFSVLATLVMLISIFPNYPKTLIGWVWVFAIALPVVIVFDLLGWVVWNNRLAQSIEAQSSSQKFSWLRIGYGLVAMLLVFGMAWWVAMYFGIEKT